MMVAFEYDNGAVGSLYYSREVPSLLRGLRLSKLFRPQGRDLVRVQRHHHGRAWQRDSATRVSRLSRHPRYKAMYRDFHRAITTGAAPEMSLERAMEDQRLMEQIYASTAPAGPMAVAR
jgi:predicted dehydrogenase